MTVDFLSEIMEARREWHSFQMLIEKYYQPRTLHPEKISWNKEEIRTFLYSRKIRICPRIPTLR